MSEWDEFDFEPKTKDDNNDLLNWLYRIRANWYWFVLSTVLGAAIAFVYLQFATPIYRINAKVLVSDEKKGSGMMGEASVLGDLSGLLGAKSTVDNEVEILKTRTLMEEVVHTLNAHVSYYQQETFKSRELYAAPFGITTLQLADSIQPAKFALQPVDTGHVAITGEFYEGTVAYDEAVDIPHTGRIAIHRNQAIPYTAETYQFHVTSIDNRVADFRERLSVEVTNKLVSVIDLSFEYPLKSKGEDVLHTLIEKYVQSNLQDKNTIADSTIAFIENRLLFVGQELGDVESDIQSFKQQSQLADIEVQSQLLLENASGYIKELVQVETQLNILNDITSSLRQDSSRVLPGTLLSEDKGTNGTVQRYNTLVLERDRQLLSATPDNPYIQNLEAQIANLRQDMLRNLEDNRGSLDITKTDLEVKIKQLDNQIRRVPATERTYLDLARQQQIKQELYIFLLQKREETAISKTANISNSRVIDTPKAEPSPISPKRLFVLAFGVLAGLAIPFSYIYTLDLLNTRVTSKEDITRRTQVPIIAEISHSEKKYTLLVRQDTRSPIAEQFRSLRTNIGFYLSDPSQKTVLLTSGMSGEGKSFVALNLAMVLAISGKKVVVMEMDLRKPNLSIKLDIKNNFGFSNYVISPNINALDIVVPSGMHDNLFLISSGPIPPNPAELLLSERNRELFGALNKTYDYIIIDAPPIGLVTDAQLLAQYADMTLYLIRQGYTHKNQLALIDELYRDKRMPHPTILVNDIKIDSRYGYGYGYGYGSYGEKQVAPKKWWQFLG